MNLDKHGKNIQCDASICHVSGKSGRLRTHNPPFDYFTCNRYQVEMNVRDELFIEAENQNLTIDITWVNKPPVWNERDYTSTILEKMVRATCEIPILCSHSVTCMQIFC